MSESRTVKAGTAGGVDINVNHLPFDHAVPKKVQLSADYIFTPAPGYVTPPDMTGAAPSKRMQQTQTRLSGTTVTLLKAEADALIAAGKATAV
jgi:hypothetical protein